MNLSDACSSENLFPGLMLIAITFTCEPEVTFAHIAESNSRGDIIEMW